MPGPLLTHAEINVLVDAALACGLEELNSRDLNFADIPARYVAGLGGQRSPLAQLNFDLEDMRQRHQLEGLDEPPLALWLRNAAERASPRLQAGIFREMRATVLSRRIEPNMPTSASPNAPSDIPAAADIHIAVLAALPLELAALQEIFGIEHEVPATAARTYEVGWLTSKVQGRHGVALALLPDMGNNLAAVAATHLAHDFPHLKHIVLCGIAGGVPRPGESEHDVRLGDVVISNRNGVVQYDLIKEHHDGTWEHRHPPRPPSVDLVQVVRKLAAGELRGKRPWEAHLTRGAAVGARPADHLDARGLPGPDLPHDPTRRAGLPRLFQATIAAANILLKNPAHRDYLSKTFGVKAVEMEGAGVADATWAASLPGYLVVRGICDHCDENKGDAWQPYAAVAAAAVTRAILEGLAGQEQTARPQ